MMKIFDMNLKIFKQNFLRLPAHFRDFKVGVLIGIILALSSFLFFHPVSAQEKTIEGFKQNTAPVTLDGRRLFKVSYSEDFTAQERAEIINSKLQSATSPQEPINIEIRPSNESPTIWLNNRYLLTVTGRDSQAGNTQQEQAEIWRIELQNSLAQAQKERSMKFLQVAFIRSLFILVFAIFCHWVLGRFWQSTLRIFLLRFIPEKPSDGDETPRHQRSLDLFLSLTLASVRVGIWAATILYIANQFPLTRRLSYQITGALISTFTAGILTLDKKSYSIPDILFLVGLLWVLIVSAKVFTDLLQSRILNVTGINRGAQEVIAVIVRYCLIFIGGIVLLQVWGLDLSSLTILASALGVGIGFGFQDIAKNFGSGIVLLFERPIQVGDFIEIGEYQGIVERVGARSTVLKTLDMISIIVPNSRFLERELINWDYDHPVSGVRLPVGVAYGSNIDAVKQSLLDVAKVNPDILAMPSPQVLFKGFGDSSLDFELRVWISQPSRNLIIRSNLYYQIEAIFRQRNIDIPFPQRDLHVRGSLPIELSSELKDLLIRLSQSPNNGSSNLDSPTQNLDSHKQ
ncbi:mechanosensitive ion channel domain-containing protein [Limnoraphis robusta Tam1]|uniref:mechanosensitive ion channel family protein n=1 Tax=Limnoraphis robusta TaxID=1118279 RepID=UPI002B1EFC86|nr:mechanosensitive ion channel domain-containing protein [Limnoraphis robusta]MEA5537878.1 mechanosensitive ion channel domain-containing protein [Limnoraphis robusta Tam1]